MFANLVSNFANLLFNNCSILPNFAKILFDQRKNCKASGTQDESPGDSKSKQEKELTEKLSTIKSLTIAKKMEERLLPKKTSIGGEQEQKRRQQQQRSL